MFEEPPFLIDVLASAAHKGDYFEEIVAEPLAIIKGDYEFLSPLQNLEEIMSLSYPCLGKERGHDTRLGFFNLLS